MTTIKYLSVPFSILLSAGCGSQPYPVHLAYPLRSDPIVDKLPATPPEGPPAAGKLDEFVAQIEERGGKVYHPANIPSERRAQLQRSLDEIFGSPAAPTIRCDDNAGNDFVGQLQLPPEKLAVGSKLYKMHCLQCHGLTGDGRGPTGQWVYPFPRDFRQGIFKYVSSAGSAARKPTRADLHRNVTNGVERTSMPSFSLLSEQEREQIVAYTIHLSIRGEVEYRVMRAILADGDDREDDMALEVRSRLRGVLAQWVEADRSEIAPSKRPTPDTPEERLSPTHQESVRRGFQLFRDQGLGCMSCHEDYGRRAKYLYDSWGGSVRPADLTEGAYRGGKTPLDLFHRIRGGIGAAGMPAATSLSEEEVWDLVHFVQALPYQRLLPEDIRGLVYPASR